MSFVKKLGLDGEPDIYLVISSDFTGSDAWYFINVEAEKCQQFEAIIKTSGGDLTSFGTIIKSGYGSYPPAEIIEYMEQKHDWDADDKSQSTP